MKCWGCSVLYDEGAVRRLGDDSVKAVEVLEYGF